MDESVIEIYIYIEVTVSIVYVDADLHFNGVTLPWNVIGSMLIHLQQRTLPKKLTLMCNSS